jgi:hypothetical protein
MIEETLGQFQVRFVSQTKLITLKFQHQFLWVVIVGAILAFLLGFGMGANKFHSKSNARSKFLGF